MRLAVEGVVWWELPADQRALPPSRNTWDGDGNARPATPTPQSLRVSNHGMGPPLCWRCCQEPADSVRAAQRAGSPNAASRIATYVDSGNVGSPAIRGPTACQHCRRRRYRPVPASAAASLRRVPRGRSASDDPAPIGVIRCRSSLRSARTVLENAILTADLL